MRFLIVIVIITLSTVFAYGQTSEQKAEMIKEMMRSGKYEESLKLQKRLEKEEKKRQARIAAYLKKHDISQCIPPSSDDDSGACIVDVIDGMPVYEGPNMETQGLEPEE